MMSTRLVAHVAFVRERECDNKEAQRYATDASQHHGTSVIPLAPQPPLQLLLHEPMLAHTCAMTKGSGLTAV